MRKCYTLLVLIFTSTSAVQAQGSSLYIEQLFRSELPGESVNIIYYNFYNGIQMVELDFESPYWQTINHYEQAKPRAIPYSMIVPPPHPNIYLFRDLHGIVYKVYNDYDFDLSSILLEHPLKLNKTQLVNHQGSNNLKSAYFRRYHGFFGRASNPGFGGVYVIAEGGSMVQQSMYERDTGYKLEGARFGLMDSLGKIVLSPRYHDIEPFSAAATVVYDSKKFGLINLKGNEILACAFYRILIQENVAVTYIGESISLYNMNGHLISPNRFTGEINFLEGTTRVFQPGKGYGVINTAGKLLTDIEYDWMEELPQYHTGTQQRYYSARKMGREYFISQSGEVTLR